MTLPTKTGEDPIFIIISVIYTLWVRKPVLSVVERFNDIQVEVRISDIFDIKAAFVISTNTTFDTDKNIISLNSLQGAFTNLFYDNIQYLDSEIDYALNNEEVEKSIESKFGGKSKCYPIGTIAKVTPKNQTAYLLAISKLNDHGVAKSDFEDIQKSLASLWNFISEKGDKGQLAIPVIGTGYGRLLTPRDVVIREIIHSFIAANRERKFTDKLTVVIAPQDYHDHVLNIYEIGEFLKYVCKYRPNYSPQSGSGKAVD